MKTEIKSNQWHSVAHSMPVIGRKVLFYFPAKNYFYQDYPEKIKVGKVKKPQPISKIWSEISCQNYPNRATHWAEIGTEGVPDDNGFIFTQGILCCLNPIKTDFSKNPKRSKIIEVAKIGDFWFYGFAWHYEGASCGFSGSGCSPTFWLDIEDKHNNMFKTKEEAIAKALKLFVDEEEQKTKKVTKQLNLF